MADFLQPQTSFGGLQWLLQNSQSSLQSPKQTLSKMKPTRVTKPRSASSTPPAARKREAALHRNPMMRQHLPTKDYRCAFTRQRSCPVSWHPTPTDFGCLYSSYIPVHSYHPAPAYRDESAFSYPASDVLASNQSFLSSLDGDVPIQRFPQLHMDAPQTNQSSWNAPTNYLPAPSQETMPTGWSFDVTSIKDTAMVLPASAPGPSDTFVPSSGELAESSSSDFHPAHPVETGSPSRSTSNRHAFEDELVGIGIYSDQPIPEEQACLGVSGKGLKLEETFTPSSNDTENQGALGERYEGCGENEELKQNERETINAIYSRRSANASVNMPHKPSSFIVVGDDSTGIQQLMNGDQQLLNLEDQNSKSYGPGWI